MYLPVHVCQMSSSWEGSNDISGEAHIDCGQTVSALHLKKPKRAKLKGAQSITAISIWSE